MELPKHLNQIPDTNSSTKIQDLATITLQAFSKSKVSYKTITVTNYNLNQSPVSSLGQAGSSWKFQIRQMSYMDVGLAWKVWDSGLLLAHWIFNYPQLFRFLSFPFTHFNIIF